MSSTISLRYRISLTIGDKERVWAQPTVAPTITLDNDPADYSVPVVAGATVILWNPTDASGAALPADFKFLMLVTDADVMIEFTCNEGNANDRVFALALKADVPLMLGDDTGYYNFTANGDVFAGTLDVIDKIRAKNLSVTDDALVQVIIGT